MSISAQFGKLLIVFGIVLIVVGLAIVAASRFSLFGIGKLPGDITYRGKYGTLYFPIVSCLILSVVLSLVFWLVSILTKR